MPSLWIDDIDLEAEFPGLYVASLPDVLNRAEFLQDLVQVSGAAGGYGTGPLGIPPKTFSVGISMNGVTVAAGRQMIRDLHALAGPALRAVRVGDRAELLIYARLTKAEWVGEAPQLVNTWVYGRVHFEAPYPVWREVSALWYGFGTTRTPLPIWNAVTAPVIEIRGPATGPIDLILSDATGADRRTSRFQTSLNTDQDFLRIFTEAWGMAVFKSTAGVLAQDDSLLDANAPYLFPGQLDPALGNPYLQHYPMYRVVASGGTPQGRAYYPKQVY